MTQSTFFSTNRLPVFEHLSAQSKAQLDAYLGGGNTAFRQKRLLEFFKMLDWVAPETLSQDRFLQKLEPALRRQLSREIQDYHVQKMSNRGANAEKREQYKLRVIEYFRGRVSAADKALLESLRDHELDLTGRDVNWRFYFTLDSFKKIDAFCQASLIERQALFERFKKDVQTYKRNYDKIHYAQSCEQGGHAFSFDDWCDLMGEEAPKARQSRKTPPPQAASSNPVYRAHQTLGVQLGATPEAVKKQFRKLTLQHHPDLPDGNEEEMKRLVDAYQEIQRYWQVSRL